MGEMCTCGHLSGAFLAADSWNWLQGWLLSLQWIWGKHTQKLQEWSKNMERLLHNKWLHRLQLLRMENMQMTQVHEILDCLETRQTARKIHWQTKRKRRPEKEETTTNHIPHPSTWIFNKLLLLLQLWLMWKEVQENYSLFRNKVTFHSSCSSSITPHCTHVQTRVDAIGLCVQVGSQYIFWHTTHHCMSEVVCQSGPNSP